MKRLGICLLSIYGSFKQCPSSQLNYCNTRSAPKPLNSTLTAEKENMLAAPPCSVDGAAALLAPRAFTASPPALALVPVAGSTTVDGTELLAF